jgi:midasin (ATPase involved in ribosome maturation)
MRDMSTSFVATPPAVDAMRALLLSIGAGKPVLVSGAPGVGKTAFLRRAAELFGQTEPVFLFCDEQTDIKLLLGTYACGKIVGEFVWRPGVITEALRQGRWLVLEDIDRVPAEVLAALLPLADSRRLTLPDRNQTIEARLGFHLFGTLSTPGGNSPMRGTAKSSEGKSTDAQEESDDAHRHVFPGRVPATVNAWTRVQVPTPLPRHLAEIIGGLFPELQPLIPQLLSTAALLCQGPSSTDDGGGSTPVLGSMPVAPGPRELLSWCSHLRHARLILQPIFTEESRTTVLREAAAVLLGRIPDVAYRRRLLANIAPIWGLAGGIAEALLEERPDVHLGASEISIGSVTLQRASTADEAAKSPFAYTSVHARVLQALASSIRCDKPVLLVGDTGTGKTSVVQHLGELLGERVLVYNFSEQSESSELIGGFRPVDVVLHSMTELNVAFTEAFKNSFSKSKNAKLIERAHQEFSARQWPAFLQIAKGICEKALQSLSDPVAQSSKGVRATHQATAWQKVMALLGKASATIAKGTAPHFEFQEGLLVEALRSGAWVVLDEINLAPGDILQRIQGLIERSPGMQLALPESGDEHILPHANFRIFACMNPPRIPTAPLLDAADDSMDGTANKEAEENAVPGFRAGQSAGKKELPAGIRARFTEVFVDEVRSRDDVGRIVRGYLERCFPSPPVDAIVKFYAQVKSLTHKCILLDGAGKVAHFSLRNLTRALRFSICAVRRPCHPTQGNLALAQGLAVGFATPLDRSSAERIERLIEEAIGVSAIVRCSSTATSSSLPSVGSKKSPNMKEEVASAQIDEAKGWVCVEGYWIKSGSSPIDVAAAHKDFVITASVRHHLQNIARMLSGGRFPVLLEGPTSSGKTSMVKFIAKLTGHECVRINNHEHTDLQEYLGQYVCDPTTGQLVFQEGVLARAARAGHWVVLDELNLAPSEVLEALNRLLDDNRELFIADTGETINPHEDFMVFATQNPAGANYGGRKL